MDLYFCLITYCMFHLLSLSTNDQSVVSVHTAYNKKITPRLSSKDQCSICTLCLVSFSFPSCFPMISVVSVHSVQNQRVTLFQGSVYYLFVSDKNQIVTPRLSSQDQHRICALCLKSKSYSLILFQGSVQYLFISAENQIVTPRLSSQDQHSICALCLESKKHSQAFFQVSVYYLYTLLRIKELPPSSLPRISVVSVCLC